MRGQAFDTFQLLIAAVIAVAILGVLLSILGSIIKPGQGFMETSNTLLGTARQYPMVTNPSSGDVSFIGNQLISSGAFATAANRQTVCFDKSATVPVNITCKSTGDSLNVTGTFTSPIYACCTASSSGKCVIGIGKTVDCSTMTGTECPTTGSQCS